MAASDTVKGLVENVYLAATEMGMDLSLEDTAFIISSFLEGLAHGGGRHPETNEALQSIADEVSSIKDEGD